MVGARKWERQAQRVDSRNGTYLRRLITSMGVIDLEVPRAREGGSAGAAVIGRYKRRSVEIDDAMVSAYVHGASTRDVGQITEALMGEHVSKSAVSRAAKTLGTKVEEPRKAPIDRPIPYLFLDATSLDARWARTVENVSALVPYGIGLDGHRQLLAVTIGAEESRTRGASSSLSSSSAASPASSSSSPTLTPASRRRPPPPAGSAAAAVRRPSAMCPSGGRHPA